MSVVLRPETLEQIQERVESGQFADADAVVSEAMELMARRDQYAKLKAAIAAADDQIARGEVYEWTDESLAEALARAKERARLGLTISDEVKP